MENFEGRVAVVTGGAAGIGLAIARRLADEGMKLALADIEEAPLEAARRALQADGVEVLAEVIDVSKRDQVFALAERVFQRFGNVHVLVNNAGVSGGAGAAWAIPAEDWEWIMSVNFYGTLSCLRAFVPRMLEAGEEGVIVNQSSQVGLSSGTTSAYGVSKYAILRLSEGLHYDLAAAESKLRVVAICAGAVATNFILADRNRPEALAPPMTAEQREAARARKQSIHEWIQANGIPPEEVADGVMTAIREGRFYVLTHPERTKEVVRIRADGIINETGPSPELA